MQRLSGMDASFLYMETPTVPMHVSAVTMLDPSTAPRPFDLERLTELIEERCHLVPQFRWKVKGIPLALGHPVWVDDPEFDLRNHLHLEVLPSPGTMRQLAEQVGRISSTPLDRDKPLWRMWLVEGLEDGRVALVTKLHHAGIDGITGADLVAHLFDFEADAPPPEPPDHPWEPERTPSDAELAVGAVGERLRNPLRGLHALQRVGSAAVGMARSLLPFGGERLQGALPFTAPRTPFNGTLTPRRVVSFCQVPLADVKHVKTTFGTTVNDVVLAASAMALRRYLDTLEQVPDKPLLAAVPVSVHGQATDAQGVNQVSNMFVRLPMASDDPVEVLEGLRLETRDAKELHNAMGADLIQDLAQITPPGVFNLAARLYSGWGLPDRMPLVHNLIISNVPGPPVPLYIAGAQVVGLYPFGPLIEGIGLTLTVLSHTDAMDFGVIACGDLVPDPWPISESFAAVISELKAAADKAG